MPFTPFHMGPGIFLKAALQGSFSLMLFGWAQIIMDIQPLVVLITGEGHLHGFSHTYLGATLLAVFSALTGKHLSEFALQWLQLNKFLSTTITWPIAFLSAFIGSYSHVLLDSIMHMDVQPFYPVNLSNSFLGLISIHTLHKICLYSGLIGAIYYCLIAWSVKAKNNNPKE